MTAERKKKTIEELKKKLPDALSKLAGKSISAVEFGKLTIAEVPSVLLLLELKVEHDAFSKLAKPGLVKNIMEVAFLFFPSICEKSASGFNPPSSSCPPPLRWLLLKSSPPPGRVSKHPFARIRRAHEGDASSEDEDGGTGIEINPPGKDPPPAPVGSVVEVNVTADMAAEASQIGIRIYTTTEYEEDGAMFFFY